MEVFSIIFNRIADILSRAILQNVFERVAMEIAPALKLALVLYVIWEGILVVRGRSAQRSLADVGWSVARACLIYLLATQWGTFSSVVFEPLWSVYRGLGSAMTAAFGVEGDSIGKQMDNSMLFAFKSYSLGFLARLAKLAFAITPLGWVTFPAVVLDVLIFMLSFFFCILFHLAAFYMLLLSLLGLFVVICFAPIFIGFYLFDSLRPIAEGWVKTALAMIMLPAFVQLTLAIFIGIQSQLSDLTSPAFWTTDLLASPFISMAIWFGGRHFLMSLPDFVGAIFGAYGISSASGAARHFAESTVAIFKSGASRLSQAAGAVIGSAAGPVGASAGARVGDTVGSHLPWSKGSSATAR